MVGSANEIAETLKIDQVSFTGTDKYSRIPSGDVDKIDDYIVSRGSSSIVKTLLTGDKLEREMVRLMASHKIEIIVQLLLSDQRIGYLCLGDKKISKFNMEGEKRVVKVIKLHGGIFYRKLVIRY